jgi:hypothetical protein
MAVGGSCSFIYFFLISPCGRICKTGTLSHPCTLTAANNNPTTLKHTGGQKQQHSRRNTFTGIHSLLLACFSANKNQKQVKLWRTTDDF